MIALVAIIVAIIAFVLGLIGIDIEHVNMLYLGLLGIAVYLAMQGRRP